MSSAAIGRKDRTTFMDDTERKEYEKPGYSYDLKDAFSDTRK